MKRKKSARKHSGTSKLVAAVRQLTQPKEFRIPASTWSPELLEMLERISQNTSGDVAEADGRADAAAYQELLTFVTHLLREVGTGLWRLRQKMYVPNSNQPLDEMRRAVRHFESVWDVLVEAGLEIRDHTGEVVPEGGVYALKAIAYEPTPNIKREMVIETIKPTIYFKKQQLQMGEVVIGTPESSGAES